MVGLIVNSKRVYTKGDLPVPLSLWWASANPHCHRWPPNTSRWFWFSLLGVTAPLLCVLVQAKFCLCPPRLESLFSPVLWKAYNQIPLALKARFPGDSQSHCQISRMGSLTWDSEPSQQCENLLGIIVLQSVGSPTWGCGIWFYYECTPPTDSLWLLLCLWTWGILFWGFQHPPVDGCSTVAILVLSQENMCTCPSIPPSWTGLNNVCFKWKILKIKWDNMGKSAFLQL